MNLTLTETARIIGGEVKRPDSRLRITGAVADSRRVAPGDAFFAMKGNFLDGHRFVAEAFGRGAAAAVVARAVGVCPDREIVVDDPQEALLALAGWVRDVLNPVVVGITGSTGKTSVKDLLASIVRTRMATVAAEMSFNNELGVPLTLLRTRSDTQVVILEMGTRGPGQIRRLCTLARPHVGVLTNVGITHYEQFGSQEAIASAKSELVQSLPEGGAVILNADDPRVLAMSAAITGDVDVLTYGTGSKAWLRAEDVRLDAMGRPAFRLVRGNQGVHLMLSASGAHQVANSLAAAAAALALGLSLDDCRAGLEGATLSPWRMQVQVAGEAVIVNDAYNASPASVAAALNTCAVIAQGRGRLIAILGYMAELGELETREHRRIGALAASLAVKLVVTGRAAGPIATGARDAGMTDVSLVEDAAEAVKAVGKLRAGDVVLVKGSRVAGLEAVAAALARGAGGT